MFEECLQVRAPGFFTLQHRPQCRPQYRTQYISQYRPQYRPQCKSWLETGIRSSGRPSEAWGQKATWPGDPRLLNDSHTPAGMLCNG